MKTGFFQTSVFRALFTWGIVGFAIPIIPMAEASWSLADETGINLHGFLDVRAGTRTQTDSSQEDVSLSETRLQLDLNRAWDIMTWTLRADLLYDHLQRDDNLDLEEGRGVLDLREANILLYPASFMDLKIGRQILTWGTGDLLFINDLFPKDWNSFFTGRDQEYLKAPSDAVFLSLFAGQVTLDVAYSPRFDSDRYIRGDRVSYWNPMLGERAGRNAIITADKPDEWFRDDEWAARLSSPLGGYELALYGYTGFWKSPAGFDPVSMRASFPPLAVYGASLRGTAGKGIVHAEAGYYESRNDPSGDNPLIPNSETRFLLGYERELIRNLTVAAQYYLENLLDYDHYMASLSPVANPRDESRHVLTLRITHQALNQTLTSSLFAYYSPSDEDAYIRPAVTYKVSDAWRLSAGGNIFLGRQDYTFFGQFEQNNNVYAAMRYSF